MKNEYSIVRQDQFIQATRNSGYKGTESALAELIDNAIQAQATNVTIELVAVEVEMKLPDREGPIMFTADVVWSRLIEGATGPLQDTTAETGVRIVTIDPKDQKFLLQYAVVNAPPPEHV